MISNLTYYVLKQNTLAYTYTFTETSGKIQIKLKNGFMRLGNVVILKK